MSLDELRPAYAEALAQYRAAVAALVPLLRRLAIAEIATVLPPAEQLVTRGEVNEDGLAILRIERVLNGDGDLLFDVAVGHDSREVEDRVDQVGPDYLDLLLDLTGDDYLGEQTWTEP